jgi:hypothetical protein
MSAGPFAGLARWGRVRRRPCLRVVRGSWCIKAYASGSVPLESQLGCTVAEERSSMDPHTLTYPRGKREALMSSNPLSLFRCGRVSIRATLTERYSSVMDMYLYSSRLLFPQPDTQTFHRSCKCTPPWYRYRMYLMQHTARRDLCISVDICCVARKPRLAENAAYLLVLRPVASPSNNTITTTITAPHDAATRSPHGSSQTSCRRNTQHNINIGGYARTPALDPRSPHLRLSIALP